ncbi:trypsin-like serine protease [Streptomyces sp. NPDC002454]|uniref:trypsin-like serine protease n=1 Tax=Streptomyces sp. NPDC002490 TaxID=3154416 RepID=UPI003320A70F
MTHARSLYRRPGAVRAAATAALSLALVAGGSALPAAAATPAPDRSGLPPAPGTAAAAPRADGAELRERLADAVRATDSRGSRPVGAPAKAGAAGSAGEAARNGTDARIRPFIVGGSATTIGSAPWMVQLWYYDENAGKGSFCGGSLVAPNKVLTAAHCVQGLDWRRWGLAQAGATNLGDQAAGTIARVHRVWKHPKYDHSKLRNDVAVLTLDRTFKQKPLPLAQTGDSALYARGTVGTAYGWGLTSGRTNAQLAPKLRKVSLPMVADGTCDSAMRRVIGRDYFVAGEMLCAGKPATGRDTGTNSPCHGDSGGPLVVRGKIVGIVSWGVERCIAKGAYPVFTKVRTYVADASARIDDSDLSYDGRADLLVRTPGGTLYSQTSRGRSLAGRTGAQTGWGVASWGLQADLDREGTTDILIRNKQDGKLYRDYQKLSGNRWVWARSAITSVGGGSKSYAVPGDLTGDGWPDLAALDSAGSVYLYPGKGNGQFGTKKKVVNQAWKGGKLFGRGDFTKDGKTDLLVRDRANTVWLYRGTGKASAPFAAKVKVRSNWSFTALVGNGDMTGDGIADVLARDSGGKLWLYPGTGKASSSIFGTRTSLGSGFNQYDLLF